MENKYISIYTLNCILSNMSLDEIVVECEEKKIKNQIDDLLKQGYAVRVGATCTGHSLSDMVENSAKSYIVNHYDVQVVKDSWGWEYFVLNTGGKE